ncbi:MAG: histidinol-phosphatase HisJ family protein [Clostridia bacterium]|nr:histidinol-phosphatase HisJ family protein [Clostridia bacterium]
MKLTKPISNLHTHTTFSDGSRSVEDNIRAAVEAGFVSLGISDHTYAEGEDCGIRSSEQKEYTDALRRIKEEYKDKFQLFCGIELAENFVCDRTLYDYIIASIHYIFVDGKPYSIDYSPDVQKQTINEAFGGEEHLYAKAYFDAVADHVEQTKPDIVGHFDLLTKFETIDENDPRYREAALNALHRCMKVCSRFEVNTGAMARANKSCAYPADFILEEIKRLGGTVTVTSDSHITKHIDYAFEETVTRLRSLGFTHIDRLTENGFVADEI